MGGNTFLEGNTMANKRTIEERIEARREEKRQLEAQIKKLLQEQRAQKNKDRTHRLCKRGGLVEKYLPELIELTDDQFQIFINKCLLSNFTMKTLSELVATNDNLDEKVDTTSINAGTDTATNSATTVENTHPTKSSDTAA